MKPEKIKHARRINTKNKVLARSSKIISAIWSKLSFVSIFTGSGSQLKLLSSLTISEEHVRTFKENPKIVKAQLHIAQ